MGNMEVTCDPDSTFNDPNQVQLKFDVPLASLRLIASSRKTEPTLSIVHKHHKARFYIAISDYCIIILKQDVMTINTIGPL